MIVDVRECEEKDFKPFTVSITFEDKDERDNFCKRFDMCRDHKMNCDGRNFMSADNTCEAIRKAIKKYETPIDKEWRR